jgi:hypothetical protein
MAALLLLVVLVVLVEQGLRAVLMGVIGQARAVACSRC